MGEKMGVAGGFERRYDAPQFPALSVPHQLFLRVIQKGERP
jgi:hypothetical protein